MRLDGKQGEKSLSRKLEEFGKILQEMEQSPGVGLKLYIQSLRVQPWS